MDPARQLFDVLWSANKSFLNELQREKYIDLSKRKASTLFELFTVCWNCLLLLLCFYSKPLSEAVIGISILPKDLHPLELQAIGQNLRDDITLYSQLIVALQAKEIPSEEEKQKLISVLADADDKCQAIVAVIGDKFLEVCTNSKCPSMSFSSLFSFVSFLLLLLLLLFLKSKIVLIC
jgi:uncharacterized membrane protein YkvA (DUF1232 family)